MKKLILTCSVTLSLVALGACGSEKDPEPTPDADAGIVADGGDITSDAGPVEDAGPDLTPDDCDSCKEGEICQNGTKCVPSDYGNACNETFQERCDGNTMVYCHESGKIMGVACKAGTQCGFAVDSLGGDGTGIYDWGVDCMSPCAEDKVGSYTYECGKGEYEGSVIVYDCSYLADGTTGAYWESEYKCDELRGCDENSGQCGKLVPDETKWCTYETYSDPTAPGPFMDRCLELGGKQGVVFCDTTTTEVSVGFCDDEDAKCRLLKDENYGACFTSENECTEAGKTTPKTCYQSGSTSYLVSYTCKATQDAGVNVWKMNPSTRCETSCIPGATEADDAKCDTKDDRVGTECVKNTPNTCGNGDLLLSCTKNAEDKYVWGIASDCTLAFSEGLCKTRGGEKGAGVCVNPKESCETEGEILSQHCKTNEVLGTIISYTYDSVCTLMSDGTKYGVDGTLTTCDKGCDMASGICNK